MNTPLHLTMYLFRLPKRASHVIGGLIMARAATTDSRHIGMPTVLVMIGLEAHTATRVFGN